MKPFINPVLRGMIRATFPAVALVGALIGGQVLHAASLQESLKALGLIEMTEDIAAPALRLPDLEGRMVSLQDYQGKVVMLYFWTTW